jgi:hypothetical protein
MACAADFDLTRISQLFVVSREVATIAVQTHWQWLQPKKRRR